MSAPTTRKRQRRPGPSMRDLGLNQRALGISPRQLRGLPEAEIQRRLAAAAEKVRRHRSGPVTQPAHTSAAAQRKRTLGIPGCASCAGSGWADTVGGVEPCPCREGEIL